MKFLQMQILGHKSLIADDPAIIQARRLDDQSTREILNIANFINAEVVAMQSSAAPNQSSSMVANASENMSLQSQISFRSAVSKQSDMSMVSLQRSFASATTVPLSSPSNSSTSSYASVDLRVNRAVLRLRHKLWEWGICTADFEHFSMLEDPDHNRSDTIEGPSICLSEFLTQPEVPQNYHSLLDVIKALLVANSVALSNINDTMTKLDAVETQFITRRNELMQGLNKHHARLQDITTHCLDIYEDFKYQAKEAAKH